ncbi:hypothetical protein HPULCUR_001892 [Helicostylum pulchrum]|uniref:Aladin seven-bladed propeller domain-containing protein n=1 Tax=Helicostylum pulchrum TaxID=562976 RepID=A0ABP9XQJ3_9FUNG
MSFLCTVPDETHGTLAELNGCLSVEHSSSPGMQELANTPLYPSIVQELIAPITPDFVNVMNQPPNVLEASYNDVVNTVQKQWEECRPAIEATPAYKQAKAVYDYVNERFFKTPETITQHPIFTNQDTIRCMAWHPHLETLAIAFNDNNVYVYEKREQSWSCQVLANEKMNDITCIEWKKRSSGTLAVGCKQAVCIWTIEKKDDYNGTSPIFFAGAFMKYVKLDHLDYISSLAWDPTPASHLLAIASASSSNLTIHDLLLNRTTCLKRYGNGNTVLRWSLDGEFLFQGGVSGISRMWDTSDWSSQQISNPPGLWVQSACWSTDNRTLFYSMYGKSDIHALFLSGKFVKSTIINTQIQSTSTATKETSSGVPVMVGGVIRDMTIDQRNGQRLAVVFEDNALMTLYSVKDIPILGLGQDYKLILIGYIRGAETSFASGALEVKPIAAQPLYAKFAFAFNQGALLATAYDNGIVSFVTHSFLTDEEVRGRFMFLEIPFPNERLAVIAQRVMDVDTELRETQVLRIITFEKNILKVEFGCYNTKMLRVAVNSFLEYLTMATRTIEEFDE